MDGVISSCVALDASCKELVSALTVLKGIELTPDDKRGVMEKAAITTKALIDLRAALPHFPALGAVVSGMYLFFFYCLFKTSFYIYLFYFYRVL